MKSERCQHELSRNATDLLLVPTAKERAVLVREVNGNLAKQVKLSVENDSVRVDSH